MTRFNKAKNRTVKASLFLIIIIISIICYANTLKNGFVYDDDITIVNNYFLKKVNNIPQLFNKNYFALSGELSYRPVVTFTYFWDYAIFGLRPWGFHLTNILLHAINGVLLYKFLLVMHSSGNRTPSRLISDVTLLVALLFISHPVLTEAVNGISFREDLLAVLFYIAALNLYIKARLKQISGPQRVFIIYFASYLLYFLALLSKEMAITFPLIVYCYEFIYHKKDSRSFFFISGYIIVTLIYSFFRFHYFYNPAEGAIFLWSLIERFFTLPWLILNYAKLIIFPISLSADYHIIPIKSATSFIFIASTILVLFSLATAFLIRKRQAGISFGILFFLITLTPVYNVIPISNPFAERYLYLPIIGLAIIAGSIPILNFQMTHRSYYHKVIYLLLLFIFIYLTIQRNSVWKNEEALWSDTLLKMPGSAKAHYSMGTIYASKEMVDAAIKEFEESIRLLPANPDSLSALGLAYYKKGSENAYNKELIEEAYRLYMSALKFDRWHRGARYNLAYFYYEQGNVEEAIREYNELLRYAIDDFDAHIGLGLAHFSERDFEKAILYYKKALDINPYSVAPYNNIGMVYATLGQQEEAEKWFKKGLEVDPSSAETYYNLGYLYQSMGKWTEAAETYKKAIGIKPDYKEAREKLSGIK